MKFESSKHETKLSMKLTEQVQARILNKTHREPANKPETTNKLKMKKTNDERWRKETDDKETPKTGDRRRQSKTSMTQQHMYLHSYESLAAPPSVVRLQYWRGYRDRSVEKSREQYTSVISRWGGNCRGQPRTTDRATTHKGRTESETQIYWTVE